MSPTLLSASAQYMTISRKSVILEENTYFPQLMIINYNTKFPLQILNFIFIISITSYRVKHWSAEILDTREQFHVHNFTYDVIKPVWRHYLLEEF